jgi:hypothetical protein
MSQMRNMFSTRFGPSPFAEMIAELQRQHHAELELMYLDAARHYGLYGSEQISQFSPFHDRKHYAGAPPSVQYLKAMFVDYITAHQVFIDCAQACLPADVMKVDHTFDVNWFYSLLNCSLLLNFSSILNTWEASMASVFMKHHIQT